jgi:MFS family permease
MHKALRTSVLLGLTSFSIYFGMYALRKPFAAGVWDELLWGFPLKIWLVSAQLLGYAAAKWWGISYVSQVHRAQQKQALLVMFSMAFGSLLLLAIAPTPIKVGAMVLNGLSLGMVWGVIFRYLEGRRATEVLGIFLSCSFVVSSGAVKSLGLWLIQNLGIEESWMPLVTGLCFAPVLLLSVGWIDRLPEPSESDRAVRSERNAMKRSDRREMLRHVGIGVGLIAVAYVLLTGLRDVRDNFAVELWEELGVTDPAAKLTQSEWPITIIVLAVFALIAGIRDNGKAFSAMLLVLLFGSLLIGFSAHAYQVGWLSPYLFMFLLGLGLYLAYIPITSILFDRLIAALNLNGNVGFFIYTADAMGYLGTTVLMFVFRFGESETSWLNLLYNFSFIVSIVCGGLFIAALAWFQTIYTRFKHIAHA